MKSALPLFAMVFALAACSDSGDEVTGSGGSSSTGSNDADDDGDADSPTDPTVTPTDSGGETTCVDGCATTEGDGTTASITTVDSSGGSERGESSSDTAPAESSSEGPAGICGNGAIEGGEDCDDSGESATCDDDCTIAECGDDTLNVTAGEICDQGGESFSCDVDCTPPVCGDGLLNASHNEMCDEGGSTLTCDDDCTPPVCGDGTQNLATLETCDDGNNFSNDGCSSNCVIEGEFGGECRIVDGTQWCFDNDHCGEACEDVCSTLGLTLEPNNAAWFAAQDTAGECQAIADAFGMQAPIQFGASPLGCLEDGGLNDLTGGGLTGGLVCSSDSSCPSAHRTDMDGLGGICDIAGARRSICPCAGAFCGNGLVEGAEACDDGNEINNDGCNTSCSTGPNVCDGGVDPVTGSPYVVCSVDGEGAWVANANNFGGTYHAEAICQELGYTGIGSQGGTCGSVCGFCEMIPSSCDANGTPNFDGGGDCGVDDLGIILCTTVHWMCI